MTAHILDGNVLSKKILEKISVDVIDCKKKFSRPPCLSVVMVGENPASMIYVNKKRKICHEIGFNSNDYNLPESTTEKDLLGLIDTLNADATVDGILIQMPLPKHINCENVFDRISEKKDVDGFNSYNTGKLAHGSPNFIPCTPLGIVSLLNYYISKDLRGIDATVIGHSNIVGKPMALTLLLLNATVSVCHVFTQNIRDYVEKADLLVVAVGKPELIKGSWIKKNAIVVDVGINSTKNGKIVGDVEFNEAAKRASWITPVPGGVGPMTIATLMENTLKAYLSSKK